MNEHFLIKFSKDIQSQIKNDIQKRDYSNIQIKTIDNKILFIYHNKIYNTIYYKLPTIIEAHKTMDKKQFFKVTDISNCLYVLNDTIPNEPTKPKTREEKKIMLKNEFMNLKNNNASEISKKVLELSGISPYLLFCKLLRFRKKNVRALETERRDHKVQQLLMRERCCSDIKIIYKEEDVSSLAAEIEYNLKQDDKVEINNDILVKMEVLKGIEEKIKIKEEQLVGVSNVILKKRFEDSLTQLRSEREKVVLEIKEMENMRDDL